MDFTYVCVIIRGTIKKKKKINLGRRALEQNKNCERLNKN